jgi:heme-degrading monooxygenase HmoA
VYWSEGEFTHPIYRVAHVRRYDSTMSDDRHVACIFRSTRNDQAASEYAEWSERMDQLVRTMPGYIGHISFRDDSTGRGVTISYFESMASLTRWREDPVHREAQALGRELFYDEYEIEVAEILRHHEWRASP